jgi:hypothetical protein
MISLFPLVILVIPLIFYNVDGCTIPWSLKFLVIRKMRHPPLL